MISSCVVVALQPPSTPQRRTIQNAGTLDDVPSELRPLDRRAALVGGGFLGFAAPVENLRPTIAVCGACRRSTVQGEVSTDRNYCPRPGLDDRSVRHSQRKVPQRMTIVKLAEGGLWILNPIAATRELLRSAR